MKSFWLLTNMVSWLSVIMKFFSDFIRGYLHTQQTIQRSTSISYSCYLCSPLFWYRVLLATIRNRGKCLCPRCLIPKPNISELGSTSDMERRRTLARVDSHAKRFDIQTARRIIYEKGYAVTSEAVEALLKDESLVPTAV